MREINLTNSDIAYLSNARPVRPLIYWELGNFCSYKCSYCSPMFSSGSVPYQDTQVVQNTLKRFGGTFVIFSGGEPTLHPDFEKIIKEKPQGILIGVVSNASRPIAFWERAAPYLYFTILTYHPENAKLDKFLEIANLVYKVKKVIGRVNVVMLPERWDECVNVYNTFVNAGINVVAKQLLIGFGEGCKGSGLDYTPEQIDWIANSAFPTGVGSPSINVYNDKHEVIHFTSATELFAMKQTNFMGWKCYVPGQYLVISSVGNTFTTSCDQKEKVGNIFGEFTFPNEPIICQQKLCWAYSDVAGLKSSPNYNGPVPKSTV